MERLKKIHQDIREKHMYNFPSVFPELHAEIKLLLRISGIAGPGKFPVKKNWNWKNIQNPSQKCRIRCTGQI